MSISSTEPVYTPVASALGSTTPATTTVDRPDQFGQDTFLKLLVAQLRYQDPMNPAEGTEFLSQTAQFTSVEKLSSLADMQSELLAAQRLLGGSNLVGRSVTFQGESGDDITGVVTAARFGTDGTVLRVADKDVPLSSVKEVGAPPASAAAAPPAAASTPQA